MLSRGLQDKEFLKNEESNDIFLLGRTRCPKQFTRAYHRRGKHIKANGEIKTWVNKLHKLVFIVASVIYPFERISNQAPDKKACIA